MSINDFHVAESFFNTSFKKKKKKTAEFLASDDCYYKNLTASHNKSLL